MANVTAGSFAVATEDDVRIFEPNGDPSTTIDDPADDGIARVANGIFATANGEMVRIYAPSLTLINESTYAGIFADRFIGGSDTFFYSLMEDESANWTLRKISDTGSLVFTWDDVAGLPSVPGIASSVGVSLDDTTLFYGVFTGDPETNEVIYAYDLENSVDLGDLVTRTGYSIFRLLGLPDGSFLGLWEKVSDGSRDVKHYQSDGTTLHTYVLDLRNIALNLARTSTSFWGVTSDGVSWKEYQVSDGSVLTTVPAGATGEFILLDGFSEPEETTLASRALRRFPLPFSQNKEVFIGRIEFLIQSGVGLLPVQQGDGPQLMARFSKDGGKTFGPEIWVSMGEMGQYGRRAYINGLGRGRNWVCEVTVSDPVFIGFITCFCDVEEGLA